MTKPELMQEAKEWLESAEGDIDRVYVKNEVLQRMTMFYEHLYCKNLPSFPKPFTGEMLNFLLVNSIRLLSQLQRDELCVNLLERSPNKDIIIAQQ